MSLIQTIKSILPVSSRSAHAMHHEIGEIHHLIEDAWSDVGAKLIHLQDSINALDDRTMYLLWENYRKEGETQAQAHRRLFECMDPADGSLRLFQLASAQLLSEFDSFCERHGLKYCMVSGTLLGAVRHQGFIPWDDDLDVGMPRRDLERAMELVKGEDRFRITVRYDYNVHCRQVRFCYADESIPCFVDLFYYDLVKKANAETMARREAARDALREEMWADERLSEWNADRPIIECDSPEVPAIEEHFERHVTELYASDGPYTYDEQEADGVILGIDNLDALVNHHRWYLVPKSAILPIVKMPFEGHGICGPSDADTCVRVHYGDIYQLPDDLASHFHHVSHSSLGEDETAMALKELIGETEGH